MVYIYLLHLVRFRFRATDQIQGSFLAQAVGVTIMELLAPHTAVSSVTVLNPGL